MASGIHQGCTASTTLFKLVTFKIIKEELNKGFKNEFKISSLFFYADDGMLLTTSTKEAEEVVDKTVGNTD